MSIQGNKTVKTEKEYRATLLDSSSSLKDFSLDRKKYFRKYLMGEDVEDKDSAASVMGRVVETLLLESHLFDSRFAMSAIASAPSALMLEFVEQLYRITREATDEQGNITKSFEDVSREAHTASGFKISYEAVIKKFIGSDAEIYFNEILDIRTKGLTVVTAQDVTNAENIVAELKTNRVTQGIVNLVDSKNYTVKNQLQVEGYEIDGHLFKSMMDKVVVFHKTKEIQVFDLKCVWAIEKFLSEYYLYRLAFIQAYLYYVAAQFWALQNGLGDYKILPPKFIVCDSTNYYNPLIYTLEYSDLDDAYLGFEYKGREYKGVKEIIEDLKFALDQNVWNISRKNYLTNGIVRLTE